MQYFNGFDGNTPIEAVAAELHRHAEGLVTGLGAPAAEERGDGGSVEVAGSDLTVAWEARPTATPGTTRSTAYVRALIDRQSVNLLALATVTPDLGTPVRVVEGFRGEETSGDYSIGTLRTGLVECKLGSLGLNGGEPVDEPFGVTQERLPRRLANLDSTGLARVRIVDGAIREGFDAIEMIQGGEPAAEVLAMMDRMPKL